MGYTTYFNGSFDLNKPLDDETYEFLVKLNQSRRMKRDVSMLKSMGFTGDYGIDGEFFVEDDVVNDKSIINYNQPPRTQPGLWCHWTPTDDRMAIVWDDGEKFYDYTEWIEYIINTILAPRGYIVNGTVHAQGEDVDDKRNICVVNNTVCEQFYVTYLQDEQKEKFNIAIEALYDRMIDAGCYDFVTLTEMKDNIKAEVEKVWA